MYAYVLRSSKLFPPDINFLIIIILNILALPRSDQFSTWRGEGEGGRRWDEAVELY